MARVTEANVDAGLIRTGVDTTFFESARGYGMDFVLERPCTTVNESGCYKHFVTTGYYLGCFQAYVNVFSSGTCRLKRYGEIDLDDITAVPDDSELVEDAGQGIGVFMCAPPDSLADYIGNVYAMKSGADPRDGTRIHAKMKVLDFWVIDDAQHEVAMVFLWAANWSGFPDVTTNNIDTFTLDYHVDTIPEATVLGGPLVASRAAGRLQAGRAVVVPVVEGSIGLPAEILAAAGQVGVYDARGRQIQWVTRGNIITMHGSAATGVAILRNQPSRAMAVGRRSSQRQNQ